MCKIIFLLMLCSMNLACTPPNSVPTPMVNDSSDSGIGITSNGNASVNFTEDVGMTASGKGTAFGMEMW